MTEKGNTEEPISVVILIRTDTTLDHSQKAEKVCLYPIKLLGRFDLPYNSGGTVYIYRILIIKATRSRTGCAVYKRIPTVYSSPLSLH